MTELKWQKAYYWSIDGRRREIVAKELGNPAVLLEAESNILTDESEQVRIYPRTPKDVTPHFYSEPIAVIKAYSGERNPAHDNRVDALTRYLKMMNGNWTVSRRDKSTLTEERELPLYRWEAETNKIIGGRVLVRHDIFGSSWALADSLLRPEIAIEVVNTHYPDEESFQAMIEESGRRPYMVFFDHVRRYNKFVEVDGHRSRFIYDRNTFYIKGGKVFQGESPKPIRTSAALREYHEDMLDAWDKYLAAKTAK